MKLQFKRIKKIINQLRFNCDSKTDFLNHPTCGPFNEEKACILQIACFIKQYTGMAVPHELKKGSALPKSTSLKIKLNDQSESKADAHRRNSEGC